MRSPTQRAVGPDDIVAAARVSFGAVPVTRTAPMHGGSFGSVWRVDLADGRRTVFKSAPEPGARLLRYEAGMLAAEAEYLRLVADVPGVPAARLLDLADEWLFMTLLPGTGLPELPPGTDTTPARRDCGAAVARLHEVTGDLFGYTGGVRAHAATWPDAFAGMIGDLLADAVDFDVALPVPPGELRALVAAHADLLATVVTPSLLHFDLWDGNVLATVDPVTGVARLSGLVDGERFLWGDPLLDLVSPALMRDILDTPDDPFLTGYLERRPTVLDDAAHRRLRLYQMHLYLAMLVEYPSRGMTPTSPPGRWDGIVEVFMAAVDRLRS
jgi:fructosamine-3-kinase